MSVTGNSTPTDNPRQMVRSFYRGTFKRPFLVKISSKKQKSPKIFYSLSKANNFQVNVNPIHEQFLQYFWSIF